MKSAGKSEEPLREHDDNMLPEYDLDYAKSRPNKYATEGTVAVFLDPDVAEVFKSGESVNHALRALISAVPREEYAVREEGPG